MPSEAHVKPATVPTRVLVLADTHGRNDVGFTSAPFDLAIHCGDLTEESKVDEFKASLELLRKVRAPTKVVIAGNHDITLDDDMFTKHLRVGGLDPTDPVVTKEYGKVGETRALLHAARDDGIYFLEEGVHMLNLTNGARVSVYANPQTPRKKSDGSLGESEAGWAFQYDADGSNHCRFEPQQHVDIFVTHGPPEGVLDYVDRRRAGCPDLFASVSRARPQLHCFGHIHAGWGAKLVTWRADIADGKPSHFTAIDNNTSPLLERLNFLKPAKFDTEEQKLEKRERLDKLLVQGYSQIGDNEIEVGRQTLFVNAAVEGDDDIPTQPPIAVTLKFPRGP